MDVCSDCQSRIAPEERDAEGPFPTFTALGGALGALAAALTGAIVLVPAALVAGALADARRCGMCGAPIAEDEAGYRAMVEKEDDSLERIYRPVVKPPPTEDQLLEQPHLLDEFSETPCDPQQQEFVFDPVEGLLVARDAGPEGGEDFGDFGGEFSGGLDMGGLDGFGSFDGFSAGGSAE